MRNDVVFRAVVEPDLSLKFLNIGLIKNHCLPLRGQIVEVTIAKARKKRSDNQNAYYWGVVLARIADYSGYRGKDELEGLHEELKRMFLPKFGRMNITRSTSALSTIEFNNYIEDVKRWAVQELGIYIPDPNEIPN